MLNIQTQDTEDMDRPELIKTDFDSICNIYIYIYIYI
jgi:hypothetical protein